MLQSKYIVLYYVWYCIYRSNNSPYFTHNIIHHNFSIAMDKFFKQLLCSQELDSTWIAKLIVDTPTPPQLLLHDNEKSIDVNKNSLHVSSESSDIIPFITKPSTVNQLIMETDLNYPKGCSFCFEGYKGVDDYEKLKNHLIDCASRTDGTQLTVAIHDDFINKPKS